MRTENQKVNKKVTDIPYKEALAQLEGLESIDLATTPLSVAMITRGISKMRELVELYENNQITYEPSPWARMRGLNSADSGSR